MAINDTVLESFRDELEKISERMTIPVPGDVKRGPWNVDYTAALTPEDAARVKKHPDINKKGAGWLKSMTLGAGIGSALTVPLGAAVGAVATGLTLRGMSRGAALGAAFGAPLGAYIGAAAYGMNKSTEKPVAARMAALARVREREAAEESGGQTKTADLASREYMRTPPPKKGRSRVRFGAKKGRFSVGRSAVIGGALGAGLGAVRGAASSDPTWNDKELKIEAPTLKVRARRALSGGVQGGLTAAGLSAAGAWGLNKLTKKAAISTPLQPHQQRVVDRMQQPDQPGLVVAHGLGSGKTLTSIAAQEALGMPSQVVVPAALRTNYAKEVKKHVRGKTQKRTIESMQNLTVKKRPPTEPMLIVDEAHRAREPGSKTLQVLSQNTAQKRMLLTGSPFYNHPADVAPLVNLAAGTQALPEGKEEFSKKYVSQYKVHPGLINRLRGVKPGEIDVLNPKTQGQLGGVLKKWVDYHKGAGEENYPTVERENVPVRMTPQQLSVYDAMLGTAPPWVKMKVKGRLPPSKKESQQLNAFLSATRQVSNSTAPFDESGQYIHEPKVEEAYRRLKENLDANPRAKAIVYSNYLDAGVNPYKKKLEEGGIPYGEFTGEMPKTKRDEMVRQYNEGKLRALLLSSAGGEGLDLRGTRLIQLLEPHWNEEKLKQVEGRGIRYKSHEDLPPEERKVLVQQFLATRPRSGLLEKAHLRSPGGSVDEYLTQLSMNKEKLIHQFRNLLQQQQASTNAQQPSSVQPAQQPQAA